jgi:3-oxoacyl-[acyl-carrier-protein] synthase-3
MRGVRIEGVGAYAPDNVITNDDLTKLVDTSDEWIVTRTGIKERRVVSGNQTVLELAKAAAEDAIRSANIDAQDIDLIVVASSTPDMIYPFVSSQLQAALGLPNSVMGFDVSLGCTAMVQCLIIARQFLQTGTRKTALVVSADIHSRHVDWTDRNTCILFGDGAGAFILKATDDEDHMLATQMEIDGSRAMLLRLMQTTQQNCPLVAPQDKELDPFVFMNGREVFKFAVETVPKTIRDLVSEAGLTMADVDHILLHQANLRIISAIADKLDVPMEKMIVNIEKYGNTSSSSIPLALNEAVLEGRVKPGDLVVICGYGAGLAWSTIVMRWTAVDNRLPESMKAQLSQREPQAVS